MVQIADFLPFKCDFCANQFCVHHKSPDAHDCSKIPESPESNVTNKATTEFQVCSLGQCGIKASLHVICRLCDKTFCVKHRHPEDHECEKLHKPQVATKKSLSANLKPVSDQIKTPCGKPIKKGAHSEALASKVALIKMRRIAVGDDKVVLEKRVYFEVDLPENRGNKTFYFHRDSSIGRAIDTVCRYADMPNSNMPNCPSMGLFVKLCDKDIPSYSALPPPETIEDLLSSNTLTEGQRLFARYS